MVASIYRVAILDPMKGIEKVILLQMYTMIYLFKAKRDRDVASMGQFITATNKAKYPEMTALQYYKEK